MSVYLAVKALSLLPMQEPPDDGDSQITDVFNTRPNYDAVGGAINVSAVIWGIVMAIIAVIGVLKLAQGLVMFFATGDRAGKTGQSVRTLAWGAFALIFVFGIGTFTGTFTALFNAFQN